MLSHCIKEEILDDAGTCEKVLDERLRRIQVKPHDPRRLGLVVYKNLSKTLDGMAADDFFRKYEEVIILLLQHTSTPMELKDLLEVIEGLINNRCFSNLEYLGFLIKQFGVQMLVRFGTTQIEKTQTPLVAFTILNVCRLHRKIKRNCYFYPI